MAVAITATEVDVYPPRVTLAVTGLTITDVLTIERYANGERVAVRGADSQVMDSTAYYAVDAEFPFGVPVSYHAVVNGADAATDGPDTYTLTGGKIAITDATAGLSAEVVITAWPDTTTTGPATVHPVAGRNVVVSGPVPGARSTVEVFVETASALVQLQSVLRSATSGIVQIRQPGGYTDIDGYYAVTSWTVTRWSQDGSDERRRVSLSLAATDAWSPELPTLAWTFADLDDAYTGETFADLDADYTGDDFLALNLTDWAV